MSEEKQDIYQDAPAAALEGINFNLREYLIRAQGGKWYCPVPPRIVFFRANFKGWSSVKEIVYRDDKMCIASCKIYDEKGTLRASDYKTEERAHFTDFIEKALTGSEGRALASLGIGTLFAQDLYVHDSASDPVDAPQAPRQQRPPAQQRPAVPPPAPAQQQRTQPASRFHEAPAPAVTPTASAAQPKPEPVAPPAAPAQEGTKTDQQESVARTIIEQLAAIDKEWPLDLSHAWAVYCQEHYGHRSYRLLNLDQLKEFNNLIVAASRRMSSNENPFPENFTEVPFEPSPSMLENQERDHIIARCLVEMNEMAQDDRTVLLNSCEKNFGDRNYHNLGVEELRRFIAAIEAWHKPGKDDAPPRLAPLSVEVEAELNIKLERIASRFVGVGQYPTLQRFREKAGNTAGNADIEDENDDPFA